MTRFGGCRARYGAVFSLSIVLILYALVPGTIAAPGNAGVTEARYEVTGGERFARVIVDLKIWAEGDGWQTVDLMPVTAMRSFRVEGKRGYIERLRGRYAAHVFGRGEYNIMLEFVLDVTRRGAERRLRLPLVRAASGEVKFVFDKPGYAVAVTPKVPIKVGADSAYTRATIFPADVGSLCVRWLPSDLERKGVAVFEAREKTLLKIESGAVKRETRLRVDIRRGNLATLVVGVPEGVDVLGVSGKAIVNSWGVTGEGAERKLRVRFSRRLTGVFEVKIVSEQVMAVCAEEVEVVPFRVVGVVRQEGIMGVAESARLRIVDAGSKGMHQVAQSLFSSGYFRGLEALPALGFAYHKLPVKLKLRLSRVPPRVTAVTASHARLQAGNVELKTKISYRIENAPVERLTIGLDEGVIVLGVRGEGVETWSVNDSRVEVRLQEPILGPYALELMCLQKLRRVNGVVIPRVRCVSAERESGYIAISAGENITLLHHRARNVVQVDVATLPEWLRELKPKLAYRYEHPEGALSVSTDLIKPALHVRAYATAMVAEDAVEEEIIFVCKVSRRPVFGFRLRLPEGLTPTSLLGQAVADWEFQPKGRLLLVSLKRACLGETRLHLFCERRLDVGEKEIMLGGVSVLDAERYGGWLGVGTNANIKLAPTVAQDMTAIDIKEVPELVRLPGVRFAYKWDTGNWGLRCALEKIAPRVEAKTQTALVFGTGRMHTRTGVAEMHCLATGGVRRGTTPVRWPPEATTCAIWGMKTGCWI